MHSHYLNLVVMTLTQPSTDTFNHDRSGKKRCGSGNDDTDGDIHSGLAWFWRADTRPFDYAMSGAIWSKTTTDNDKVKDLLTLAFGKMSVAVKSQHGSNFVVQTPTSFAGTLG